MLAYVGLVAPDFFRLPGTAFNEDGLDAVSAHNTLLGADGKGPMWWLLLCLV